MSTSEPQTCGKGLAENSILPAKLGEVIDALAGNLEAHMPALDQTDPNSQVEYRAYENLTKQFRQIADQFQETAQEMAGYQDLPMGRHDQEALTHPRIRAAFENFVQRKQELRALLEQTTQRDNQLLEMIRSHIPETPQDN
jgi:methyl-accepting chemotaxis protein